MAFPDDYSDDFPPWGKRARLVPLRTYSGRVVYQRKKHHVTAADAARFLRAIEPPSDLSTGWFSRIIQKLQEATVFMLQKLLPFLSAEETSELYFYLLEVMDTWFLSIGISDVVIQRFGRGLIRHVAEYLGIEVTIKGV